MQCLWMACCLEGFNLIESYSLSLLNYFDVSECLLYDM